ncbi:mucin-3A-like [Anneissia japonica]|uniref:mucin-3A-like n=1 Tax=Anneissia japonica TaxID=1529436 RepID=UPI001425B6B8|nr:mucin-3A-like [Anneissia japonica]
MRTSEISRQPTGCILKSIIICLFLPLYLASTEQTGTARIETDYATNADVSSTNSASTTQPRFISKSNTIIYDHNNTTSPDTTRIETDYTTNADVSFVTTITENVTTTGKILFFTDITTFKQTIKKNNKITSDEVVTTSITGVTSNKEEPTIVELIFGTTELPTIPSTHNIKTPALTNDTNTKDSGTGTDYTTDADVSSTYSAITTQPRFISTMNTIINKHNTTTSPDTTRIETDYTTNADISSTYSAIATQPRFTSTTDTYSETDYTTDADVSSTYSDINTQSRFISTTNTIISEHNTTTLPDTTTIEIDYTTNADVSSTHSAIATQPRYTSTTDTYTETDYTTDADVSSNYSAINTQSRFISTTNTIISEHNTTTLPDTTRIETDYTTNADVSSTYSATTTQPTFTSTTNTIINEHNTKTSPNTIRSEAALITEEVTRVESISNATELSTIPLTNNIKTSAITNAMNTTDSGTGTDYTTVTDADVSPTYSAITTQPRFTFTTNTIINERNTTASPDTTRIEAALITEEITRVESISDTRELPTITSTNNIFEYDIETSIIDIYEYNTTTTQDTTRIETDYATNAQHEASTLINVGYEHQTSTFTEEVTRVESISDTTELPTITSTNNIVQYDIETSIIDIYEYNTTTKPGTTSIETDYATNTQHEASTLITVGYETQTSTFTEEVTRVESISDTTKLPTITSTNNIVEFDIETSIIDIYEYNTTTTPGTTRIETDYATNAQQEASTLITVGYETQTSTFTEEVTRVESISDTTELPTITSTNNIVEYDIETSIIDIYEYNTTTTPGTTTIETDYATNAQHEASTLITDGYETQTSTFTEEVTRVESISDTTELPTITSKNSIVEYDIETSIIDIYEYNTTTTPPGTTRIETDYATNAQHDASTLINVSYEHNTTTASRTNVTTHIQTLEFSARSVSDISTADLTTDTATTSVPTTTHLNNIINMPTTDSNFRSATEQHTETTTGSRLCTHGTTTLNTLHKTTRRETVLSQEIANITKNVTNDNIEEVAVGLEVIVEKAELEPADVKEVSNALETIAKIKSPNENVTGAVVGTVDAIIASDSSDSNLPPETTALILESFEQQISTAATDGQNYTQDEDTLSVRTLSFNSNLNSDVEFVINENETPYVCFEDVCLANDRKQSVKLPKDLLTSYEERTNISFTSFYNPNLFQSGAAEQHLSSVIMSATIYNDSLPEVFQNPVKLVFNVPESYSNSNVSCVFWNATLDGNGNWSIKGCKRIDTGYKGSVTCHCTHLTHFAVLFFPNEIPPGVNLFLDLVTYIGCGVSIICLVLTVVTVLSITCYLSATKVEVFIYTIIIPIGLVMVFNFVIFVLTIKKLFFSSSMVNRPLDEKEKKKRLVNAIAISLLLGLTWIFGFLSFENDADIVFLILFCVFNSFQGVAIFYLFCLRQKECKEAWQKWLGIYKLKTSYNFSLRQSTSQCQTTNDLFRSISMEQKHKAFNQLQLVENPAFENTVD